jgi:hypothetical protein
MDMHYHLRACDTEVTGRVSQTLDPNNDPLQMHHTVTFYDIPTGYIQTLNVESEVEMFEVLRLWLIIDGSNDTPLKEEYKILTEKYFLSSKFLP